MDAPPVYYFITGTQRGCCSPLEESRRPLWKERVRLHVANQSVKRREGMHRVGTAAPFTGESALRHDGRVPRACGAVCVVLCR